MSSRKSVYVAHRVIAVEAGVSPNQFVGQVTVEMKVFFPPYIANEPQVQRLVEDSYAELQEKLDRIEWWT